MKKIIMLIALITFAAAGSVSAAALASGSVTSTDGLSIYGGLDATVAASATAVLIGKTSKGVKAGVNYTETTYAINAKHNSGSKAFGTAQDSTAIYTTELAVNATLSAPSAADTTSFATWTAM